MILTVFGASGPTGIQVVRQALALEHRVIAVTRKPADYPLDSPLLKAVGANVTDLDGVERALSGSEAVISTFGVPYSLKPITVYSQGVANIARAMTSLGITRLVCVSSTTVAAKEAPGETLLWRKVVIPMLRNTLGRTLYEDMLRMERIVQSSGLDWTIVRPAGLFNTSEPTRDYDVSSQRLPGRFTSRADLAQTLIREASQSRHSRVTIEVITRSGRPSAIAFFKEAFRVGK